MRVRSHRHSVSPGIRAQPNRGRTASLGNSLQGIEFSGYNLCVTRRIFAFALACLLLGSSSQSGFLHHHKVSDSAHARQEHYSFHSHSHAHLGQFLHPPTSNPDTHPEMGGSEGGDDAIFLSWTPATSGSVTVDFYAVRSDVPTAVPEQNPACVQPAARHSHDPPEIPSCPARAPPSSSLPRV